MRCPDCNKFASYDDSTEPELDELNVNQDGDVTSRVRVVLTHDECGTELKEYTFDLEVDAQVFTNTAGDTFDLESHQGEGHGIEVESDGDIELTSRTETVNARTGRPVNPRYARTFYGYRVGISLNCACGSSWHAEAEDEIAASQMDEMV